MLDLEDKPRAPIRVGDTEKITINLGYVDLGHIDLLVAESVYANRATSSARPCATRSPATAT